MTQRLSLAGRFLFVILFGAISANVCWVQPVQRGGQGPTLATAGSTPASACDANANIIPYQIPGPDAAFGTVCGGNSSDALREASLSGDPWNTPGTVPFANTYVSGTTVTLIFLIATSHSNLGNVSIIIDYASIATPTLQSDFTNIAVISNSIASTLVTGGVYAYNWTVPATAISTGVLRIIYKTNSTCATPISNPNGCSTSAAYTMCADMSVVVASTSNSPTGTPSNSPTKSPTTASGSTPVPIPIQLGVGIGIGVGVPIIIAIIVIIFICRYERNQGKDGGVAMAARNASSSGDSSSSSGDSSSSSDSSESSESSFSS